MRSGTSFFDLTIYRKTLTRFWPLWTVNLVIWLFILPFSGLIEITRYQPHRNPLYMNAYQFARSVGDYATGFGIVYALVIGLVVAMAVCSHLYNNRSANFMGALPARREGQFLSTYLSGLTMLLAPNVVIFLLTLLVEAIGGAVMWAPLLFWLGALCGMELFFYSFAVCLGQFTGHILVLPVYYGIFNVIVLAVYALLNWVMDVYYFGFYGMDASANMLIYWCTPVMALLEVDIDVYNQSEIQGVTEWIVDIEGLWIVGVYAIVAVVLAACALLLYRRRHLETAGDIVAVKVMRPVFKYGVAVCAGLFLGFLTQQMLGGQELLLMVAVIIWGIIGYFVAQMLLDKTIRVFKKWKGAAAVTAAFLVLFAVIGFDLTGYETRVPAANEVQSVVVSGVHGYPYDTGAHLNVTLTDPESIADVVALHEVIVELGEEGEPDENANYTNWLSVRLTYTLKSGGLISRSYNVPTGERLTALAQDLRDNEEVRYKTYELDILEEWRGQGARLETATVYWGGGDMGSASCGGDDAQLLWEAVMADFEAGRIGIHVVDETQWGRDDQTIQVGEQFYTTCDVEFHWIGVRPGNQADSTEEKVARYRYVQFAVLDGSARTLEVLEQLEASGVLEYPELVYGEEG